MSKTPMPAGHGLVGELGGQKIKLQVADTAAERAQGLSGQASLAPDVGMLFVFDVPDEACFWMQGMRFGLDMLWFDANQQLIYQKQNMPVASYPESFCPPEKAKYVLELNAGISEKWGLKSGTQLKLCKSSSILADCSL